MGDLVSKKRNNLIKIRLSSESKDYIARVSEKLGISISEMGRQGLQKRAEDAKASIEDD